MKIGTLYVFTFFLNKIFLLYSFWYNDNYVIILNRDMQIPNSKIKIKVPFSKQMTVLFPASSKQYQG